MTRHPEVVAKGQSSNKPSVTATQVNSPGYTSSTDRAERMGQPRKGAAGKTGRQASLVTADVQLGFPHG